MSDDNLTVQTRSQNGGLQNFTTIKEAMKHAWNNKDVWKISFAVGNECVRLTRNEDGYWMYDPIYLG
jgi:hypothetical protein